VHVTAANHQMDLAIEAPCDSDRRAGASGVRDRHDDNASLTNSRVLEDLGARRVTIDDRAPTLPFRANDLRVELDHDERNANAAEYAGQVATVHTVTDDDHVILERLTFAQRERRCVTSGEPGRCDALESRGKTRSERKKHRDERDAADRDGEKELVVLAVEELAPTLLSTKENSPICARARPTSTAMRRDCPSASATPVVITDLITSTTTIAPTTSHGLAATVRTSKSIPIETKKSELNTSRSGRISPRA